MEKWKAWSFITGLVFWPKLIVSAFVILIVAVFFVELWIPGKIYHPLINFLMDNKKSFTKSQKPNIQPNINLPLESIKPIEVFIDTIGTADCEWTSFYTWESVIDRGLPETLFVLVLSSPVVMEKELLELNSIFQNTPSDILIISSTGHQIFWKISGVINNDFKSMDSIVNSSANLDYISQVKSFVGNKYNKPAVIYENIYKDDKLEEKKKFFIPKVVKSDDEIISYLIHHPELLKNIDKDTLKKILKLKFKKDNYDIQIWPDLEDEYQAFALIQEENIGSLLILIRIVENEISFETVKQMRMSMDKIDANKGFIVTTSDLLDSSALGMNKKFRISVITAEKLQQWLMEYKEK